MHRNQHRESRKVKKWINEFQTEEQDKSPETDINKSVDTNKRELK